MQEDPENHTTIATVSAASAQEYSDDIHSCCSTPYVSAPSSPDRTTPLAGFYYSAPASPTHFVISTTNLNSYSSASIAASDANSSFEFDFSATFPSTGASSLEAMISADELFCNGQIRPMKLSTHLLRPQFPAPLIESDDIGAEENYQTFSRGRELKFRAGSLRRKTRSMSPSRTMETKSVQRQNVELLGRTNTINLNLEEEDQGSKETTPCASRSPSAGRNSRRWMFLKEFLYRSKSEGRNDGHSSKFWGSSYFSPVKDNKKTSPLSSKCMVKEQSSSCGGVNKKGKKKAENNTRNKNGLCRRRLVAPPSVHELHYTANRAQAEEMRKITFLPYRQGLLACLGFSSNSYGPMPSMALLEL
ncbi:hypothetical protein OROMI_018300 [Orobanche minor]